MKSEPGLKIFLFYHFNPVYKIESEYIFPVQLADIDCDFLIKDDGGSGSIRGMNKYIAEYSGMYYLWKSVRPSCDFIGLGHYGKVLLPSAAGGTLHLSVPDFLSQCNDLGFSKEKLAEVLDNHDVVLPHVNKVSLESALIYASSYIRKKFGFRSDEEAARPVAHLARDQHMTMRQHYAAMHFQDDFEKLLDAIEMIHGATEREACEKVAETVGEINGNLVYMRWSIFDQFMAWSFPLMQHLMKEIDFTHSRYSDESYQIRVFGFLSERMLTMFVRIRDFRCSENHTIALVSYPAFQAMHDGKVAVSLDYLKELESLYNNPEGYFKGLLEARFPYFMPMLRIFYRALFVGRFLRFLRKN